MSTSEIRPRRFSAELAESPGGGNCLALSFVLGLCLVAASLPDTHTRRVYLVFLASFCYHSRLFVSDTLSNLPPPCFLVIETFLYHTDIVFYSVCKFRLF